MTSLVMSRGRSRGFSLIEMAVVLAIVGMLTGYAICFSQTSERQHCNEQTRVMLTDIRYALDQFIAAQGRLPLPAGRSLGIGDPAFGTEVASGSNAKVDRVALPTPVVIGALPFVALGLPPSSGADCWGNKFTYAVTESLTTAAGYLGNAGGIELHSGPLAMPVTTLTDGSYVVFSHGNNALGASAQNYTGAKKNCNAELSSPTITRIDKENCDVMNNVFYNADFNDGDNQPMFFDDLLIFGKKAVFVSTPAPPTEASCDAGTITWGGNCSAPALITLGGLSVSLTNITAGYTGLALSVCSNGVRTTLGTCLPIGACTYINPRDGSTGLLLNGIALNYGTGVCKKYSCCTGVVNQSTIFSCVSPLDLPGIASGC